MVRPTVRRTSRLRRAQRGEQLRQLPWPSAPSDDLARQQRLPYRSTAQQHEEQGSRVRGDMGIGGLFSNGVDAQRAVDDYELTASAAAEAEVDTRAERSR